MAVREPNPNFRQQNLVEANTVIMVRCSHCHTISSTKYSADTALIYLQAMKHGMNLPYHVGILFLTGYDSVQV